MKVIIIEDEKPSARRLGRMLNEIQIEVTVLIHSVAEAVIWFQQNKQPDLILLDIQLSDGIAFEIFEQVQVNSAIIFTTAYDEYALRAFKLNSIDYLLKPIDREELKVAIEKFKSNHHKPYDLRDNLSLIKRFFENPLDRNYKKRFTVKIGQHLKMISIENIECFYSENKGTYIYVSDNRDYLIDSSLEQLESSLDPMIFFRVNRKFCINIKSIKDIRTYSNSRLKIRLNTFSNQEIVVSREKVKEFKKWLE